MSVSKHIMHHFATCILHQVISCQCTEDWPWLTLGGISFSKHADPQIPATQGRLLRYSLVRYMAIPYQSNLPPPSTPHPTPPTTQWQGGGYEYRMKTPYCKYSEGLHCHRPWPVKGWGGRGDFSECVIDRGRPAQCWQFYIRFPNICFHLEPSDYKVTFYLGLHQLQQKHFCLHTSGIMYHILFRLAASYII